MPTRSDSAHNIAGPAVLGSAVRSLVRTISPESLCLAPAAAEKFLEHPLLSPLFGMTLTDKTEPHLRRALVIYTRYFTNLTPLHFNILFLLGVASDKYNWVNLVEHLRQDGYRALSACDGHINRDISIHDRIQRVYQPTDPLSRHPVSGFVLLPLLAGETHGVPVFATRRKFAAALIGTAEESLMDGDVSPAKCSG